MTTYTLAIGVDMILGTVPDGQDINANVAKHAPNRGGTPAYEIIPGCTLTDDEPEDSDTIVWQSGSGGWIFDETGRDWKFAVRSR